MMKNIVKETANELGMTQKQLAEYIGVREETISKNSLTPKEILYHHPLQLHYPKS